MARSQPIYPDVIASRQARILVGLQKTAGNRAVSSALAVPTRAQRLPGVADNEGSGRGSPLAAVQRAPLRDLEPSVVTRIENGIARGNYQNAIQTVVEALGKRRFPLLKNVKGRTFIYEPRLAAMGKTMPTRDLPEGRPVPPGELLVMLGPAAFKAGVPVLFSTMIHEHAHIDHFLRPREYEQGLEPDPRFASRQRRGIREFLAHSAEIDASLATGISVAELKSLGRRLWYRGWLNMSDSDRSLYRLDYDSLLYSVRLKTGDFSWAPDKRAAVQRLRAVEAQSTSHGVGRHPPARNTEASGSNSWSLQRQTPRSVPNRPLGGMAWRSAVTDAQNRVQEHIRATQERKEGRVRVEVIVGPSGVTIERGAPLTKEEKEKAPVPPGPLPDGYQIWRAAHATLKGFTSRPPKSRRRYTVELKRTGARWVGTGVDFALTGEASEASSVAPKPIATLHGNLAETLQMADSAGASEARLTVIQSSGGVAVAAWTAIGARLSSGRATPQKAIQSATRGATSLLSATRPQNPSIYQLVYAYKDGAWTMKSFVPLGEVVQAAQPRQKRKEDSSRIRYSDEGSLVITEVMGSRQLVLSRAGTLIAEQNPTNWDNLIFSVGPFAIASVLKAGKIGKVARLGRGSGARATARAAMRRMGLEEVKLAGRSYNSGRKALEAAGFRLERVTGTGRKVFVNARTGAQVVYDSGTALAKGQRAHWHIYDWAGRKRDRLGRLVRRDEVAGHIPAAR